MICLIRVSRLRRISNYIIAGSAILFITNCSSARYSSEFKTHKKQLDTLSYFDPIVRIMFNDFKTQYIDTVIGQQIKMQIGEIATSILSSKYILEKQEIPEIEPELLDDLYCKFDNSKGQLNGIPCATILKDIPIAFKHRFVLLITFNSKINPDYGPHHNIARGMATNSIIFASHTKPSSKVRLLVLDTKLQEVVYYDLLTSTNYDPRIRSEVEHIIRNILRGMYYK